MQCSNTHHRIDPTLASRAAPSMLPRTADVDVPAQTFTWITARDLVIVERPGPRSPLGRADWVGQRVLFRDVQVQQQNMDHLKAYITGVAQLTSRLLLPIVAATRPAPVLCSACSKGSRTALSANLI